jgi:hypothetical protein
MLAAGVAEEIGERPLRAFVATKEISRKLYG